MRFYLKIFGWVFGLNLIFLLAQFVFVSSVSLREDFASLFTTSMGLPASQYWRFVEYGFAQVGCYFIFSFLLWGWICLGVRDSLEKPLKNQVFWTWLSSITLIFVLNLWKYPASQFNWFLLPGHTAVPLVLLALVWFVHQSRFSFYRAFLGIRKYYKVLIGLVGMGLLIQLVVRIYDYYSVELPEVSSRPNVILIGLDDLRPDVLKDMPVLSSFLAKSANFTESVTPEARTFVAWTSLLTGLYPKEHGIRFDMQSVDHYTPPGSLAQILKDHGYATFYSTDDDQYADITKDYGFDHVLVPKMDADEYILSLLNDLPLTNLISQTWLGKWLFPDTYNNRAAAALYEPLNYNREVLSALKQVPNRPIFLAIHFNLSHQPFYWSKRPLPVRPLNQKNVVPEIYRVAARDMDWQLGEFLKGLKNQGLLKNAIVVIFSDHGESLGLPKERLVSLDSYVKGPKSSSETIPALSLYSGKLLNFDQMFGHGTDILSKVQWHQVLGIKWVSHSQYIGTSTQRVSLIDVKPTILDLLGIPSTSSGESLKPMVMFGKSRPKDRYFFIDTGFNPFAIQDLYHVSGSDVALSLKYFEVLPDNGRLVIRSTQMPALIEQVQHAVVYKNWVLAVYPARQNKQVWVLVDMNTRQWTDDFSLPFAQKAPVSDLMREMKRFYGDELALQPKITA